MKRGFYIVLVFFICLATSCVKYPDQYDAEKDKDISLTYYDNTTDFSQYATYSIVDQVGDVGVEGDSLIVTASSKSSLILNKIEENLANYGLQKVDSSANPDLLINAHVLTLDVEYASYYGGYWDMGYYYSYDPYYYGSPYYWGYGGYSYYYPYSYSYTYSSTYGSLLMEILDRKNKNETTNQIKMIWTGMVVGTVNSSTGIDERITSGIDECFAQSSYLGN